MQENLKGITMHTSVIRVEKCVYRKYSVQLFPGDPEFTSKWEEEEKSIYFHVCL